MSQYDIPNKKMYIMLAEKRKAQFLENPQLKNLKTLYD